ncbi:hypothetical protein [Gilvimarinus polysaccharolyticus]|uniref:hypothetical protein n=1 Tax=Gilvimarinus polysaccharolyticus TaxID=863921 RepID=UPI0018DB584C|nr:hypothetical protein [Gilvimarinus polysaccharolyticus]
MTEVYLLQNQDKLFLSKQRTWLDGRDPAVLYRSPNKDEAVNEMFEASSKDYRQRVSLVSCPLNERRNPIIDPDILPPPQPKRRDESSLELDLDTTDTQTTNSETEASPIDTAAAPEPESGTITPSQV